MGKIPRDYANNEQSNLMCVCDSAHVKRATEVSVVEIENSTIILGQKRKWG